MLSSLIFSTLLTAVVAIAPPPTSAPEFVSPISSKPLFVPNAYIVQLNNESHISASELPTRSLANFHKRAEDIDYTVRKEFDNPSLFFGLSITLKDNVPKDQAE